MAEQPLPRRAEILSLATKVVAAYAGNNATDTTRLIDLLDEVFIKLSELALDRRDTETLVPAVPIKRSMTPDYIICLEDGKRLRMLRRHLMSAYGMTPNEYRAKWGLPRDYPMVSASYSAKRQAFAKEIGLGRGKAPEPVPARAKQPSPEKR